MYVSGGGDLLYECTTECNLQLITMEWYGMERGLCSGWFIQLGTHFINMHGYQCYYRAAYRDNYEQD